MNMEGQLKKLASQCILVYTETNTLRILRDNYYYHNVALSAYRVKVYSNLNVLYKNCAQLYSDGDFNFQRYFLFFLVTQDYSLVTLDVHMN